MTFRKLTHGLPIVLTLVTCTSCQWSQLAQIDRNGDGEITADEVVTTAMDFVCGTQAGSTATGDSTTGNASVSTDTTSDGAPAAAVAN